MNLISLNRLKPTILLFCIFVLIASLTRCALLLQIFIEMKLSVSPLSLLIAFIIGSLFDIFTAILYCGPVLIFSCILPDFAARNFLWKSFVILIWLASVYLLLFTSFAEWFFWEEFGSRFNFIAVDYLLYTHEVWNNLQQSYPIYWYFFFFGILTLFIGFFCRKALLDSFRTPLYFIPRLKIVVVYILIAVCIIEGVNSDYREFSQNDVTNELAGNGIFQFFAANFRNELDFTRHYKTLPQAIALQKVQQTLQNDLEEPTRISDWTTRHISGSIPAKPLPNIVLISIESMGAEFLGSYGNHEKITPELDKIAKKSLWFRNVFATGNRTVRGLEALTLSLPPTPGQSIVRRPHNDNLFSIASVLKRYHYQSIFAYGGYSYFDNMNAFFSKNGYQVIDRKDIPKDKIIFSNAWGIADETLFDHLLIEFDKLQNQPAPAPFFAHIMTVSNHRPYTYPEGRIDIPSGTGRSGAVKYSDYTIGKFLRDAEKHAWFSNTIFIITADHGANARGSLEIPVEKYKIPVFFYAPHKIKPQKIDRLMSQIDIAPTVLGLLNLDYDSKFMGRDILKAPAGNDRAFVGNFQTVGLLTPDHIAILQPKKIVRIYEVDAQGHLLNPIEEMPGLTQEAISFYQIAAALFSERRYQNALIAPQAKEHSGS